MLVNNLIGVTATNSSNTNLNAYAISLSSAETTKLTNQLVDKGYIESSADIQAIVDVYTDSFEGESTASFNLSKVSNPGDRVAIFHYNETENTLDMIALSYLGDDCTLSCSLDSYSPIIVINVTDYNHDELLMLQPGLYDADENLLTTWDASGIDDKSNYSIEVDATNQVLAANYSKSACNVIKNDFPTATKIVLNKSGNIGWHLFSNCDSITEIYIGDQVDGLNATIGGMFPLCTNLTTVEVSKNNKVYDSRNNCNAIMETATNRLMSGCSTTVIPDDTTEIARGAFFYTNNLVSIDIPDSVERIGICAFQGSTIETIELPDSVKEIGSYAFKFCYNLREVDLGSSIQTLGSAVFRNDTLLKTIYLPSSLNTIVTDSSNIDKYYGSPFLECSPTLKIYCGASGKQSGWAKYWNYYDTSNQCSTQFNVTKEQYETLYKQ